MVGSLAMEFLGVVASARAGKETAREHGRKCAAAQYADKSPKRNHFVSLVRTIRPGKLCFS